jgi:hypothetical protein
VGRWATLAHRVGSCVWATSCARSSSTRGAPAQARTTHPPCSPLHVLNAPHACGRPGMGRRSPPPTPQRRRQPGQGRCRRLSARHPPIAGQRAQRLRMRAPKPHCPSQRRPSLYGPCRLAPSRQRPTLSRRRSLRTHRPRTRHPRSRPPRIPLAPAALTPEPQPPPPSLAPTHSDVRAAAFSAAASGHPHSRRRSSTTALYTVTNDAALPVTRCLMLSLTQTLTLTLQP